MFYLLKFNNFNLIYFLLFLLMKCLICTKGNNITSCGGSPLFRSYMEYCRCPSENIITCDFKKCKKEVLITEEILPQNVKLKLELSNMKDIKILNINLDTISMKDCMTDTVLFLNNVSISAITNTTFPTHFSKLTISSSSIKTIESHSFRNRGNHTISFIKCNITEINTGAFRDDILIHELLFDHVNIEYIQSNAILSAMNYLNITNSRLNEIDSNSINTPTSKCLIENSTLNNIKSYGMRFSTFIMKFTNNRFIYLNSSSILFISSSNKSTFEFKFNIIKNNYKYNYFNFTLDNNILRYVISDNSIQCGCENYYYDNEFTQLLYNSSSCGNNQLTQYTIDTYQNEFCNQNNNTIQTLVKLESLIGNKFLFYYLILFILIIIIIIFQFKYKLYCNAPSKQQEVGLHYGIQLNEDMQQNYDASGIPLDKNSLPTELTLELINDLKSKLNNPEECELAKVLISELYSKTFYIVDENYKKGKCQYNRDEQQVHEENIYDEIDNSTLIRSSSFCMLYQSDACRQQAQQQQNKQIFHTIQPQSYSNKINFNSSTMPNGAPPNAVLKASNKHNLYQPVQAASKHTVTINQTYTIPRDNHYSSAYAQIYSKLPTSNEPSEKLDFLDNLINIYAAPERELSGLPNSPSSLHRNQISRLPNLPSSLRRNQVSDLPNSPSSLHRNQISGLPNSPLSLRRNQISDLPDSKSSLHRNQISDLTNSLSSLHRNQISGLPNSLSSLHRNETSGLPNSTSSLHRNQTSGLPNQHLPIRFDTDSNKNVQFIKRPLPNTPEDDLEYIT